MKHLKIVSMLCFVTAAFCVVNMGLMGVDAYWRNYFAQHPEQNPLLTAQNRDQALYVSKLFFFVNLCSIPGSLLGAVLNVMAGVKIRTGEGKGLVTLTALLNLVPCAFGCCLVSIPVGIYMVVVLNNPEVKNLFLVSNPLERKRLLEGDSEGKDPEAF